MRDPTSVDLARLWQAGARGIVFFDGVCGLCNSSLNLLIERDKHRRLRFAPIQGETYRQLLGEVRLNSVVLLTLQKSGTDGIFRESDAVLRTAALLGGPWNLATLFRLIPRFLRDTLYRLVASHRYHIFGKHVTCRIPTPEERALFLD